VKKVHILNGDSLKNQLKGTVQAERIVMRECLIDGNIQGETLVTFYANRAAFTGQYEGCTVAGYYQYAAPEINKINALAPESEVYCWFEDDLFCQANLWFVLNLLIKNGHHSHIYLIRPNKANRYNFNKMTDDELNKAFDNKQLLLSSQLTLLAELWPLYQQNNVNDMLVIAKKLRIALPFLLPAIAAHECRAPDENGLGYPQRQLLAIMQELDTTEFGPVFQCFSEREGIYSFGDLQVKQMFEQLVKQKLAGDL